MRRLLVLFAREPVRQAREKGLLPAAAGSLFLGFARGWRDAARLCDARFVIATPDEDRPAWERALEPTRDLAWIAQRGHCLGARLEDAARQAAALGGTAVLVGGDVPPSPAALLEAFEGLERGLDACVSPASDGGVSLVALTLRDADLLARMRPRSRTVLRNLLRALAARERSVRVVSSVPDVDSRCGLRSLLRRGEIPSPFLPLARRALAHLLPASPAPTTGIPITFLHGPPVLRGPPLAA